MKKEKPFDLNLLPVFEAIMRYRTVSQAARSLGASQPAVSQALNRLRKALGDDLFIRTNRGMEPTPFTLQIINNVRGGLDQIHDAVTQAQQFVPASSQRRFKLLMSDAGEAVFLPLLTRRLRTLAPHATLDVRLAPQDRNFSMLESGAADVAIGGMTVRESSLFCRRLLFDRYVVACDSRHPWVRNGFDLDDYFAADHLTVRPANMSSSTLDLALDQMQRELLPTVQLPHFLVVSAMLDDTQLVATIPSLVAHFLRKHSELRIFELPFESPRVTVSLFWHARQHRDAGNRWLRNLIIELASEIDEPIFEDAQPIRVEVP